MTALVLLVFGQSVFGADRQPNIVFILADDLGYGDVQCLNPRGKIPTPNMDRLAREGMVFTDAHASAAICSPSRYSILTGRYGWRSKLQKGALPGAYGPSLIGADRMTVASLLREHGYHTACIGKWHVGLTMPLKTDWRLPIPDAPTTRGFDEFFGIAASLDMAPYAYIQDDKFTAPLDTEKEFLKGRRGPAQKDIEAIDVLPTLTRKAVEYIAREGEKGEPFFLYMPLTSPHTPLVPTKEWQGKSRLGDYGDFVMQTDWVVGQVLEALERAGVADNTLVIMTSDNGCAPYIGIPALEKQGHFPSAQYRGYKSDIWEGGHREPLLVRWPGVVKAGSSTDALVCLSDFMATCADIVGQKLPDNAGEDSVSFLPVLRGAAESDRSVIVHHSGDGFFSIREGNWKLVLCAGSGGWGKPTNAKAKKDGMPAVQLYDLSSDVGETRNVEAKNPKIVARLTGLLEKQIADGRSTPGVKQANEAEVVVMKPYPAGERD